MVRDGVTYHAISSLYPMYVNGRRSVSEAVMFGLATFKLLFASFDVLDVDQIPFIPLFSARIVTWIRGKKMHATWHEVWSLNDWTQYTGPVLGRIAYAVERWALFLPDVIISNSSHTTKRLTESGVKTRIVEVPLGVDIDAIAAIEPAPTRSDVVFVGRLVEHKHVDTLVEALSIVKKTYAAISCVIIGDGPEREALEYSIRAYSLTDNVRIVSNLESCALYSLMKASRMLVLPSTREGFGLTVLEAHAAGLPVITTRHNNNAAKDLIVEGVNGFLVEPNPQMIADTIVRVLELGESMKPRAHIDAFDWRFVLQRLEVAFS